MALDATSDTNQLLSRLKKVIDTAASEIGDLTEAERSKTGIHSTQGSMSVAGLVERLIVAHAEAHVNQVQAALEMPGVSPM